MTTPTTVGLPIQTRQASNGPQLADILDLDLLAAALEQKYVRAQTHPTEPLAIVNYTDACMWDRAWNSVTMACRGIVYRTDTDEVVARSWKKFFNHDEPSAPRFGLNARAVVTDKMDGSLAILYPLPSGGYAIATRGSFTSEQAVHATRILHTRYAGFEPPPGVTMLFEIIYPANRIVLDYGDRDDLVFLGAVHTATGRSLPGDPAVYGWPGPAVPTFGYASLAQALSAPPRPNAEGLVVHFVDTDERCKIKQDDYRAMHRILAGTSGRTLWQYLAVNACQHLIDEPKHWGTKLGIDPERAAEVLAVGPDWLRSLIERVPDEFFDWVRSVVHDLQRQVYELHTELQATVTTLREQTAGDRKAFALAIAEHPHSGALFFLLDGRDITTYLWRQVYPQADRPWMTRSEETA